MNDEHEAKVQFHEAGKRSIFASFLRDLVRDAFKLIIAFVVGTGAAAVACWYYEIPLVFSLLGGILVLGLALALSTDSLFS